MIEKKIFEIIIANDGTLTSVPNIALKQNENNSIFRIKTDALSDGGIIKLNFIKADDTDYAVQYATLSDNGVYEWNLQEYLTSVAPDSSNEIKLSISAIDYDEVIFTTLPITIALTQTNSYSPSVTNENTTDALSHDLNEAFKQIIETDAKVTLIENDVANLKGTDAKVETLKENFDNFTEEQIEIDAQQDEKINAKLDRDILKYDVATVFISGDWLLFERNGKWYKYPANTISGGGSSGQCSLYDRGTYLTLEIANATITDGKLGDYVIINAVDSAPLLALFDIDTNQFELSGSGVYVSEEEFVAYKNAWNLEKQELVIRIDDLEKDLSDLKSDKYSQEVEVTSEFISQEVAEGREIYLMQNAEVVKIEGKSVASANLTSLDNFTSTTINSYYKDTNSLFTMDELGVTIFVKAKLTNLSGEIATLSRFGYGTTGYTADIKSVSIVDNRVETSFVVNEAMVGKNLWVRMPYFSTPTSSSYQITEFIVSKEDIPYTPYYAGFKHAQLNELKSKGISQADIPYELVDSITYGIGDLMEYDSIEGNKHSKGSNTITFNGSETWNTGVTGGVRYFTSPISNAKASGKVIFDYPFTLASNGANNTSYTNGTNLNVYTNDYGDSVEEWKTHLESKPLTIVYETNTPTITTIDTTNIGVVKNGNLSFTDTDIPLNTKINYALNLPAEVNRMSAIVTKLDNEVVELKNKVVELENDTALYFDSEEELQNFGINNIGKSYAATGIRLSTSSSASGTKSKITINKIIFVSELLFNISGFEEIISSSGATELIERINLNYGYSSTGVEISISLIKEIK